MSSIRILHVVRAGRADGGMENGIVNLAERMDPQFILSVCALDVEETFSARLRRSGSRCFVLPPRRSGVDWSFVHRLARLIRKERIDVVHSHNWGTFLFGVLAGRIAGVRVIHGEHGKGLPELQSEKRVKRFAKTWLGRQADLILTVCEDIRSEWIVKYRIPASMIEAIHNGVDSERFAPAPAAGARAALGLPPDAFIVGTVGRFDPIKNYPALMSAVGRLAGAEPSVHVVFVGSGPMEAALREQAAAPELDGRVHFLGWRRDVEQLLRSFDLFVLPSFSEGMSNVLLEAMSCGVTPVCADIASHREIVTSAYDAVLLKPCDEVTLAATIRELCADPERRGRLARNARETILRRFTLDRMVRRYEDAYRRVAENEQ